MTANRLALITLITTYILIVFGGYVASSESGLGCGPEWPLCNGDVIPTLQGETLIEFAHRVIGAGLGIMTIFLSIMILRMNPSTSQRVVTYWMLGLLTIQILFGAVIVFYHLPAIIITIHLLIGIIFMALLIFIWRSTMWVDRYKQGYLSDNTSVRKYILTHVNIILGLLLLTITIGAYVKHQQYGLACDWLGCRQSFLPATGDQLLQTLHRVFAVITTVYTLLLTWLIFTKSKDSKLKKRMILVVISIILQMMIGVIAIMTNLELSWAVIHLAVATALFGIIIETRVYLHIKA